MLYIKPTGYYEVKKNDFSVCHFSAPDKNPQNIRVQASQPKEMIIKWEVCINLLVNLFFFGTFYSF